MTLFPVPHMPPALLGSLLICIVCVDQTYAADVIECPDQAGSESLCPTLKGAGPNGEIQPREDRCQLKGNVYRTCRTTHRLPVSDNVPRCSYIGSRYTNLSYSETSGSHYPGSPIRLTANYYNFNFTEDPHCPYAALNITWQPPTDASVQWLQGFLLNITHSSSIQGNGSPSKIFTFNVTRISAQSDFSIVFDCMWVEQFNKHEIRVSSLPRSLNDDNTVSINLEPSNQHNCTYRSSCYRSPSTIKSEGSTVRVTFETYPAYFSLKNYQAMLYLPGNRSGVYGPYLDIETQQRFSRKRKAPASRHSTTTLQQSRDCADYENYATLEAATSLMLLQSSLLNTSVCDDVTVTEHSEHADRASPEEELSESQDKRIEEAVFRNLPPREYGYSVWPKDQCCYERGKGVRCKEYVQRRKVEVTSSPTYSPKVEAGTISVWSTTLAASADASSLRTLGMVNSSLPAMSDRNNFDNDGDRNSTRLEDTVATPLASTETRSVATMDAAEGSNTRKIEAIVVSILLAMILVVVLTMKTSRQRMLLWCGVRLSQTAQSSMTIDAETSDVFQLLTSNRRLSPRLLITCADIRLARVCRLLGDLLSQRCRCDVRIEPDLEYSSVQMAATDIDSSDIRYCDSYNGPRALIVAHSTPPPMLANSSEIDAWLNTQHWNTSLVKSLAVWMGLGCSVDKSADETDHSSFAIFHVYFRKSNPLEGLSDNWPGEQLVVYSVGSDVIDGCMPPINASFQISPPDPIAVDDDAVSMTSTTFDDHVNKINTDFDRHHVRPVCCAYELTYDCERHQFYDFEVELLCTDIRYEFDKVDKVTGNPTGRQPKTIAQLETTEFDPVSGQLYVELGMANEAVLIEVESTRVARPEEKQAIVSSVLDCYGDKVTPCEMHYR